MSTYAKQKIAIACDGSDQSKKAIELTAKLPFGDADFEMVSVAAVVDYDDDAFPSDVRDNIETFNTELKSKALALLEEAKELFAAHGRTAKTKMLFGNPVDELTHYGSECDLMVMGSRGMNPVKSFFLGSVSDGVLRHAECSVLLYKDGAEAPLHKKAKVIVGFDDTESSRKACQFLKNFNPERLEEIHLLAIIQMSFHYGMSYSLSALDMWPQYKMTVEQSLAKTREDLAKDLSFDKIEVDMVSETHDVADELNDQASKLAADLVVIGSKGKNFIDRLLVGSVSNRLAHHAKTPILVVR